MKALAVLAFLAAPLAAQQVQTETGPNDGRTRALSGDLIIFRGHVVRLEGVKCPAADTAEGKRAKALANTFLRTPFVECDVWSTDSENWRGSCATGGYRVAKGRDMAAGLIASGLCRAR